MDLTQLIKNPETMNKETLYDLRSLLALYPYYQTARMLLLQNLYLLHDPSFDEELRRAAIYLTDRRVIFQMIEAAHYKIRQHQDSEQSKAKTEGKESRTSALIDNFLGSLRPEQAEELKPKRRPTPADASVDYVAYLLETETEEEQEAAMNTPQMKGQSLIDDFINNDGGSFTLQDTPVYTPNLSDTGDNKDGEEESYFTETLARIYIKQQHYEKALDIMQRIEGRQQKHNPYSSDQMRFLEKLIANNKQGASSAKRI